MISGWIRRTSRQCPHRCHNRAVSGFASAPIIALCAALLLLLVDASFAETQPTYRLADGAAGKGQIVAADQAGVTIETDQGKQQYPWAQLDRISLTQAALNSSPNVLLIDNDGVHADKTRSATIKLAKGMHRFTLYYWQQTGSKTLSLRYTGPDGGRRTVSSSFMRRPANDNKVPASPGFDTNGYRIGEKLEQHNSGAMVTYHPFPDGLKASSVKDWLSVPAEGDAFRVSSASVSYGKRDENFGLIFRGYFYVRQAGVYKFDLASDDGSRLYIGEPPAHMTDSAASPWRITTTDGSVIMATIDSLADGQLSITTARTLKSVKMNLPWSGIATITNTDEPVTQPAFDTADSEAIGPATDEITVTVDQRQRTIPCHVVGMDEGKLLVDYRGQTRKIDMSKVDAIARAAAPTAPTATSDDPAEDQCSLMLHLSAGQRLHGQITDWGDSHVTIALLAGGSAKVAISEVHRIYTVNGRRVDLTTLTPTKVDHQPYFQWPIPPQFYSPDSGETLKLPGRPAVDRGIVMTSRTRISYDLGRQFKRLNTTIAMISGESELGDAAVRVLGDGKVLFEKPHLTRKAGAINIDVSVADVEQLTFEVDFGENRHVGDVVGWAEPALLREGANE